MGHSTRGYPLVQGRLVLSRTAEGVENVWSTEIVLQQSGSGADGRGKDANRVSIVGVSGPTCGFPTGGRASCSGGERGRRRRR